MYILKQVWADPRQVGVLLIIDSSPPLPFVGNNQASQYQRKIFINNLLINSLLIVYRYHYKRAVRLGASCNAR